MAKRGQAAKAAGNLMPLKSHGDEYDNRTRIAHVRKMGKATVKKSKKKWDDEEEGRKPWEAKKKPSKKGPPAQKATPGKKPSGPGSIGEDVIGELDAKIRKRNKDLSDKYGEGPAKKKKRK